MVNISALADAVPAKARPSAAMAMRRFISVTSKAGKRDLRRRIGTAKHGILFIGRPRQLADHAVEIGPRLVDVAELQPAVGQCPQKLAAAVLLQLVPSRRGGGHDELEVAD